MALGHRVVGAHADFRRILETALGCGHVLGNIDDYRPRTSGAGDVKRLLDGQRQIAHVLHQEIVLHTMPGDANRIALLESILADVEGRHLPGEYHHRDRIHVGRGDAGHGIGRTGARGHQRDADLAGSPGITVGRVNASLLVANQNMLDLILLEQLVVNVQNRPAGVAEHVVDLFFLQAPDYNLSTGYRCHWLSPVMRKV